MSRIVRIFTAPNARHPMQEHTYVRVLAGIGIEGDRYALGLGQFSNQRETIRHATFIAREAIAEANAILEKSGVPIFDASETRRNFVTEGIDLNCYVGIPFMANGLRFRGVELADPCHLPAALLGKKGFKAAFAGLGGLRAEALDDGLITVGDLIQLA